MSVDFSPSEEHYLKRELLRLQLSDEFELLNDQYALRKFGYPFSDQDPESKSSHKRIKHVLNTPRQSGASDKSVNEKEENGIVTDFPMLRHFLRTFVMSLPLLSQDLAEGEEFWQEKVQVFFEHFMGMNFSSSFDREEETKRKKIAIKLSKVVLLMYNSGIGCSREITYYEHDKFELQDEDTEMRKRTKMDKFVMPTRESLRYLLTSEPLYINGWDVNVIAVTDRASLYGIEAKVSKPTTPKWMRSTFGLSPTSFTSPSKLFSKLTMADTTSKASKYLFIVKIRKEDDEDNSTYAARSYEDFKGLARNLKKEFPGKALPKLPHRSKVGVSTTTTLDHSESKTNEVPSTPRERIVSVFPSAETPNDRILPSSPDLSSSPFKPDLASPISESSLDGGDDNDDDFEEFKDASDSMTSHLPREKMRTSLRQYLRTLCEEKEIAHSLSIQRFLVKQTLPSEKLTKAILQDMKNRESVDVLNLENQITFQKLAFEKSLKLQDTMKEFKTSVLKDQTFLLGLFQEIRDKEKVEELSPTLVSFFDWCKVNLSATIYQLFLGNDSGYEFYTQIKRLHKLLPYTVMIQILRFTNPMAIIKNMMDLFMARPFGGKSLLQTMFSTILTDDLKSQSKIAKDLEETISKESSFGAEITEALYNAIFKNDHNEYVDMTAIHEDAMSMSMPLSLVIGMKCCENKKISQDALSELIESYTAWKNHKNSSESVLSPIESNSSLDNFPGLYFSHVRGLLQTYIRERDKKLMRQIWQDPQLPQLLKSMVALFYEPLVKIFRVSKMDVAFKSFEKFMDDLIELIDNVINGQAGYSTAFNVVDGINKLVDKHEGAFYAFVHDICIHDTEHIFEGFIRWLTMIVNFFQKSKYGQSAERVDLVNLVNKSSDIGIDIELLRKQLADVIANKKHARQIYQKLVDAKRSKPKNTDKVSDMMKQKWRQSKEAIIPNGSKELGFQDGELVDLDLDVGDFEYLHTEEDELQQEYRDILERQVDESEISKFNDLVFKDVLRDILKI